MPVALHDSWDWSNAASLIVKKLSHILVRKSNFLAKEGNHIIFSHKTQKTWTFVLGETILKIESFGVQVTSTPYHMALA